MAKTRLKTPSFKFSADATIDLSKDRFYADFSQCLENLTDYKSILMKFSGIENGLILSSEELMVMCPTKLHYVKEKGELGAFVEIPDELRTGDTDVKLSFYYK